MKSLLMKFCTFGQKTALFCKHIGCNTFKKSKLFYLFGKKTFLALFALENNHSHSLFNGRVEWSQNMECLFVVGNLFFSFFKSIKFLFLLFFFCFSSIAWSPSEINCRSSYKLKRVDSRDCTYDEENKICKLKSQNTESSNTSISRVLHTHECFSVPGDGDPTCDVRLSTEYTERKEECERWREDKQREEESAITEAEKQLEEQNKQLQDAQDRADQQRQEQKALVEASKQECKSQYEQFRGERNSIEDQVRDIEKQIDKNRQDIINQNIEAGRDEEEIKQSIQKLKENHRNLLNDWETKISTH